MRFVGLFPLVLVALAVALSGCSDAPELVQIQGRVTRGGKPVPNIIVRFNPIDARPSWGQADEEGKFELHYNKQYEGARLGKHKVSVGFDNRPETPFDESGKQKLNADQQDVIKKYGNPETSPIEVELTEDGQVVNILLD